MGGMRADTRYKKRTGLSLSKAQQPLITSLITPLRCIHFFAALAAKPGHGGQHLLAVAALRNQRAAAAGAKAGVVIVRTLAMGASLWGHLGAMSVVAMAAVVFPRAIVPVSTVAAVVSTVTRKISEDTHINSPHPALGLLCLH